MSLSRTLDGLRTIEEFDLNDKRVFLRLDLNVPLENGKITDEARIEAALPTIKYAVDRGAKLVLASHLGRPSGPDDKANSLEPVANRLGEILGVEVILVEEPRSEAPKMLLSGLKPNQIVMLENLRFDPGEEENDLEFAKCIAEYTDIYINDAFGASHRAHMSIVRLPQVIAKKGLGFLMRKEAEMLDRIRLNSEPPFLAILGGAKVSDKITVIETLIDKLDALMIGGAMAYTFLSAEGYSIGNSRIEKDRVRFAGQILERMRARGKTVLLPMDHLVVQSLSDLKSIRTTDNASIESGFMGVDIGPKTLQAYSQFVKTCKTIFWNGPMGVFEKPELAKGTFGLAKALAESSATTVVGGGDSAAAARISGVAPRLAHVSTGGGASLEYLEGRKLPGFEALRATKQSEPVIND